MKKIYSHRTIDGKSFILAEKIDHYVQAQVAAQEYRCEGFYCRVEPVEDEDVYYVWTFPGRLRMPRTLQREEGQIRRGSVRFLSAAS